MDGGVRRGTDVVKALALGARAVLVGPRRPLGARRGRRGGRPWRARAAPGRDRERARAHRLPDAQTLSRATMSDFAARASDVDVPLHHLARKSLAGAAGLDSGPWPRPSTPRSSRHRSSGTRRSSTRRGSSSSRRCRTRTSAPRRPSGSATPSARSWSAFRSAWTTASTRRLPRLPRPALERPRPDEGRRPLRRRGLARRVRRAGHLDDLEVRARCASRTAARRAASAATRRSSRIGELQRLTRRFTSELLPIIGPQEDIPAPDMATNEQTMAWMMDTYSMQIGYAVPGDRDRQARLDRRLGLPARGDRAPAS